MSEGWVCHFRIRVAKLLIDDQQPKVNSVFSRQAGKLQT